MDRLSVTHPLIPWRVPALFARLMLWLTAPAAPSQVGLPRPDHPPLAAHPTVSQNALDYLRRGEIIAKPDGDAVGFVDGTHLIVCCTGYNVSFPFFDPAVIAAPDTYLRSGGGSSARATATSSSSGYCSRSER